MTLLYQRKKSIPTPAEPTTNPFTLISSNPVSNSAIDLTFTGALNDWFLVFSISSTSGRTNCIINQAQNLTPQSTITSSDGYGTAIWLVKSTTASIRFQISQGGVGSSVIHRLRGDGELSMAYGMTSFSLASATASAFSAAKGALFVVFDRDVEKNVQPVITGAETMHNFRYIYFQGMLAWKGAESGQVTATALTALQTPYGTSLAVIAVN